MLEGGLPLRILHRPGPAILAARLAIPGGSGRDPAGQRGAHQLLAGSMTRGCGDLDAEALADRVEGAGAVLRAEAHEDGLVLALKCAADDAPSLLPLLAGHGAATAAGPGPGEPRAPAQPPAAAAPEGGPLPAGPRPAAGVCSTATAPTAMTPSASRPNWRGSLRNSCSPWWRISGTMAPSWCSAAMSGTRGPFAGAGAQGHALADPPARPPAMDRPACGRRSLRRSGSGHRTGGADARGRTRPPGPSGCPAPATAAGPSGPGHVQPPVRDAAGGAGPGLRRGRPPAGPLRCHAVRDASLHLGRAGGGSHHLPAGRMAAHSPGARSTPASRRLALAKFQGQDAMGRQTCSQIAERMALVLAHGLPPDHVQQVLERAPGLAAEDLRAAACRWLGTPSLSLVGPGSALEAAGLSWSAHPLSRGRTPPPGPRR